VDVVKNPATGEITELHCTYDPATRGGDAPDGRKVKATLHWVSAEHAVDADVRLYDRLFTKENPDEKEEGKTFKDFINPDSLETLTGCKLEPSLAGAAPEDFFQFERLGYFCADAKESSADHLVFNRTVTLKDTWAKIAKAGKKKKN
jgi:glutaminyl-tRNA synthetase